MSSRVVCIVLAALSALALALVVAATSVDRPALLALGVAGTVLLAAGAAATIAPVGLTGLLLLGAAIVFRAPAPQIDLATVAFAGALLAIAELAFWAAERTGPIDGAGVVRRKARDLVIATAVGSGAALCTWIGAVTGGPLPPGGWQLPAAVVACGVAFSLVAAAARRRAIGRSRAR